MELSPAPLASLAQQRTGTIIGDPWPLLFFTTFLCMGILPAYKSVHHLHVWYPQKPREHLLPWNWSYIWL